VDAIIGRPCVEEGGGKGQRRVFVSRKEDEREAYVVESIRHVYRAMERGNARLVRLLRLDFRFRRHVRRPKVVHVFPQCRVADDEFP
jgi:hypothetical protein